MSYYWITTHAMVTRQSGDRMNVGFVVRADFDSVAAFTDHLNTNHLIHVERIETKRNEVGKRIIVSKTPISLSGAAVATLAPFNGDITDAN